MRILFPQLNVFRVCFWVFTNGTIIITWNQPTNLLMSVMRTLIHCNVPTNTIHIWCHCDLLWSDLPELED